MSADTDIAPAIEDLFRREHEPMYRLAFTMLGSDADADEIVQDAFVAVAARWSDIENPGGYLRTSVVNGARKRMRSGSRRDRAVARLAADVTEGENAEREYLLDALDSLPERQRVAIVLTYYAGLRSVDVGEALGCSPATVRSLLHRGLGGLREVVER